MDINTSFYIDNGCFSIMISKVQVLSVVVVVVTIHISLTICLHVHDKTPIATVKLHYRGFPGSEHDILPYAVIQRIEKTQNALVAHQMPSKDVQYNTALSSRKHSQWQPVDFKRHRGMSHKRSTNSHHRNSSAVVTNATSHRKQLRSERSRKNIRHFKLYDDDGEHLLDLKVDKNERRDIEKHSSSDIWKPTAIALTAMEGGSTMVQAKRGRQIVLRPAQSSGSVKRVRHYWLNI